jgi:hypothetical protein
MEGPMGRRHVIALALATVVVAGAGQPAVAAKAPATWDDLVQVKSKHLKLVYLAPGADFRGYAKVMLDPTEIAFHKDWQNEQNGVRRGVSSRISDSEVEAAITQGEAAAAEVFAKAFADGGLPVVTSPGPDVLRVKTGIVNISVTAPERQFAGRSRTYSENAGEATFVIEVRDSVTGALLGRAVDRRWAGANLAMVRNSVTNRADFRALAASWAKASVAAVNELRSLSAPGAPRK